MRCEIISDGVLESSANALLGDGGEITLGQNGIDDLGIAFTKFRRYCRSKRKKKEGIG